MMRCMVPDTGITINPIGEIVLCCAGDHVSLGHIKDIDDVSNFFNSDIYNNLRVAFKNQNYFRRLYEEGEISEQLINIFKKI